MQKDELDRLGHREVLNFGHTFGHALESFTHYAAYQHGEAVIWGMRFAIQLSEIRGHLKQKDAVEILNLLQKISELLKLIQKDKKASAKGVRFVLIKKIGQSISDHQVTEKDLKEALARLRT